MASRLKESTAHVEVTVDSEPWKIDLDSAGNLTAWQKRTHRRVNITAPQLVRLCKRLRDGSLGI